MSVQQLPQYVADSATESVKLRRLKRDVTRLHDGLAARNAEIDIAEHALRMLTLERDRWRRRALEAETKLRSMGASA